MTRMPTGTLENLWNNGEELLDRLTKVKPFGNDVEYEIDELIEDLEDKTSELVGNVDVLKRIVAAWRKDEQRYMEMLQAEGREKR